VYRLRPADSKPELATGAKPSPRAAAAHAGALRKPDARWRDSVALTVTLGWVLLNIVDTPWAQMLPYINPARVLVPASLCLILIFEPRQRSGASGMRLGPWVGWILAAGMLSSAIAYVPSLGMLKLALYMGVLIPICLSRSLRDAFSPDAPGLRCLGWVMLAMLAASAVLLPINRTGLYDNPNKLGMLTVCGWPLLMWHIHESSRTGRRIRWVIGWAGLVMCIVVCVATWSRGGIVSLAAGLVAYAALRRSPTIGSLLVGFLFVAALGALLWVMGDVFREYAYKGRETLLGEGRTLVAQETLRAWMARPLLGYGFGLSWTMTPEDAELVFQTGRMSWFSLEFGNSTLAMLSGGGLVIAALFYGMIGSVCLAGVRSLQLRGTEPRMRDLQLILVAGIIGMLVHSQAEAWLMAPLTWPTVLFWVYVAVCAYLGGVMTVRERRGE
jgi:hypothetical protein